MFPVRCYTCNTVLGHLYPLFMQHTCDGRPKGDALTDSGVYRICCRRMFLSHVDLISNHLEQSNMDKVLDQGGTKLRRETRSVHTVECD
jgi:DNA-directed RNA polymerase subunit N